MAEIRGGYKEVTDLERVIVRAFLEKLKSDPVFRETLTKFPFTVLDDVELKLPLTDLLRPGLLEALGKLRRASIEEVGIDISAYREVIADSGYPLPRDAP
jgi:hypothetical protein